VPSNAFLPQASLSATLAPLADGSRKLGQCPQTAPFLRFLQPPSSLFVRSVYPDFYRDAFSFVRNHQIVKLLKLRKKKKKPAPLLLKREQPRQLRCKIERQQQGLLPFSTAHHHHH
jgi:hypothetical protein